MKQNEYDGRRRDEERNSEAPGFVSSVVEPKRHRFPHCLVWTPIPCITWLFPFIGHMGIATSSGVIRDFAGSYYVSEDEMAFGWPTRYLQLNLNHVGSVGNGVGVSDPNGSKLEAAATWDRAVFEASEMYKRRVHNLLCDNCHSHCAVALEKMRYGQSSRWNMVRLAAWMFVAGRYVDALSVVKTWLPFLIIVGIVVAVCVLTTTL